MSGLNLDWNMDLDAQLSSSQHDPKQRRSTYACGSSLDWNMDLDDILKGNNEDKDVRRHSEPTSLPSRTAKIRKEMGLSVKFGSVTVRECERILGDNPACQKGPSLSIGWKHKTYSPIQVDDWEDFRQHEARRFKKSLVLSASQRLDVAKEAGYSQKHIDLNVELIHYFHEEREETLLSLHLEKTLPKLSQAHIDELDRATMPQITGEIEC